ncbi:hypothetical protein PQX77_017470 [Marasmius sp. AFHP31]|nr:hypothetical protein PQX77_017470 [Marasmius sp. AFHP31]
MATIDPQGVVFERCFYIGNLLQSFMYGITVYLAYSSISMLRSNQPLSRGQTKGSRQFLIIYVIAITVSMTFALATNGLAGQMMWIEHRDFEGGPFQYFLVTASNWTNVLGTAMDMFGNFLGDLLLVCEVGTRLFSVFEMETHISGLALPLLCYLQLKQMDNDPTHSHVLSIDLWVILLPSFLLVTKLGQLAMAIVSLIQSALPGSSFFTANALNFGIPWISLTCALNVILTVLISAKLLWARRRMNRLLQSKEMTDVYTGVVAILVESALPFSILGIVFAILLAKENFAYAIFSAVWGAYVGVAPLLIIHRVANGKAWNRNTAQQLSSNATSNSFMFGNPGGSTSITMSTLRNPTSGVQSTVSVEKKYDLAKSMTSNSDRV